MLKNYKMSNYCDTETVQKAVELTVVDLKRFDLAKYARDKLSLSQKILSWLLHYTFSGSFSDILT